MRSAGNIARAAKQSVGVVSAVSVYVLGPRARAPYTSTAADALGNLANCLIERE